MRRIFAALFTAVLAACASTMTADAPVTPSTGYIVAAIADTHRPQADRDRDALRHPADILAFSAVRPGQRVADVGPGGGYYTRMFSTAVGPEGRVYGVVRPPATADAPPPPVQAIADDPTYANVRVSRQDLAAWNVGEPLDLIFISQIYHDFHLPRMNLDVAAVNRTMFAALRPGGTLVIIDHSAVAGTDLTVPDALHRIDQAIVRRELEAAGFVYVGETDVLRNPADDRTVRVFEGAIRGRTDQFAMRFRRP